MVEVFKYSRFFYIFSYCLGLKMKSHRYGCMLLANRLIPNLKPSSFVILYLSLYGVMQDRPMISWVDHSSRPCPYPIFILFYLELLFNGLCFKYGCFNLDRRDV
eukprot:TRINITY_DN29696_c1_g1_i1.p1 TRINITY_DN29696_c1_g1~~TRINITY_DN29696_c1_g1_i1.p1  ORF type:complete len:104 (-),score=3.76 TRINITY_DN29696_c1_g1_i1:21-332(-)